MALPPHTLRRAVDATGAIAGSDRAAPIQHAGLRLSDRAALRSLEPMGADEYLTALGHEEAGAYTHYSPGDDCGFAEDRRPERF
jgi:hypothetical protein